MPSKLNELLSTRATGYFANNGIFTLQLVLVVAQISSYATGYDGSMMNGLQSLTTWQEYFGSPTGSLLGFFNCVQPVGQIVSFPVEAWFSDKYGRRFGMIVGAFIILVGCILQGAAQNIGMFIAARFIITAFPSHRGPLTAVYNSLWNVGSFTAAWITYGTFTMGNNWAWRIPSLLQMFASVIQIICVYLCPESPRWLVENDRIDEATRVLTKYHPNDPIIELELAEIHESILLHRQFNTSTSYLTMIKTPANRHRTLVIIAIGFFSQWSGNGLISYYLSLILTSIGYTDSKQQLMINGILQAFSLVTSVGLAFLVNKIKRRTLWLTSTIGLFVTFVVWTACEATYEISDGKGTPNLSAGKAVLALIFIINFIFNIGWTPLQVVYCIEILPPPIRARGLAIYNICVSLAGFLNQYLNPVGLASLKWKYYIIYDVWLLIEVIVVYFFFKETQGMSLEETAAIFDGPDAVEDIARKGEDAVAVSVGSGGPVAEITDEKNLSGSGVAEVKY